MSEFEMMNEQAFDLIRQNRGCHPEGTPLRLIADDKVSALVNRAEAAEQKLRNAEKTISQLETDLRAVRFLEALPAAIAAVAGFLLGLIL